MALEFTSYNNWFSNITTIKCNDKSCSRGNKFDRIFSGYICRYLQHNSRCCIHISNRYTAFIFIQ
nr:MAG TPA: hypothetical protein [Caudoviricetes sp.]